MLLCEQIRIQRREVMRINYSATQTRLSVELPDGKKSDVKFSDL